MPALRLLLLRALQRPLHGAAAGSDREGATKNLLCSETLLISHKALGTKQSPCCHASWDTWWLAPASGGCHISLLFGQQPFKLLLHATSV